MSLQNLIENAMKEFLITFTVEFSRMDSRDRVPLPSFVEYWMSLITIDLGNCFLRLLPQKMIRHIIFYLRKSSIVLELQFNQTLVSKASSPRPLVNAPILGKNSKILKKLNSLNSQNA